MLTLIFGWFISRVFTYPNRRWRSLCPLQWLDDILSKNPAPSSDPPYPRGSGQRSRLFHCKVTDLSSSALNLEQRYLERHLWRWFLTDILCCKILISPNTCFYKAARTVSCLHGYNTSPQLGSICSFGRKTQNLLGRQTGPDDFSDHQAQSTPSSRSQMTSTCETLYQNTAERRDVHSCGLKHITSWL